MANGDGSKTIKGHFIKWLARLSGVLQVSTQQVLVEHIK